MRGREGALDDVEPKLLAALFRCRGLRAGDWHPAEAPFLRRRLDLNDSDLPILVDTRDVEAWVVPAPGKTLEAGHVTNVRYTEKTLTTSSP